MNQTRKTLLILLILFSVAGCDRATKILAMDKLSDSPPLSFLGDAIVLLYAENTGAFLGFGSGFAESVKFLIFILLPILMLCALLAFLFFSNKHSKSQIIGYSLVTGGGHGILYDRIFRSGHVIDFINIGVGPVRTGIFNVADAAILAGFIILLYQLILNRYFILTHENISAPPD